MSGGAVISPCGRYRYRLWRAWERGGERVHFIGLNPSTADADQDDPTIRRMVGFARRWGDCYGGIVVTNLFAYRATDARELSRDDVEPFGGLRNHTREQTREAPGALVVACWGAVHGWTETEARIFVGRWHHLDPEQRPLHALGTTKAGHPRHPLYLPKSAQPSVWSEA